MSEVRTWNTLSRVVECTHKKQYKSTTPPCKLHFSLSLCVPLPPSGLVTWRYNKFRRPRQSQQRFRRTCVAVPVEKEFPAAGRVRQAFSPLRLFLTRSLFHPRPRHLRPFEGSVPPPRARTFSFTCATWFMLLEAGERRTRQNFASRGVGHDPKVQGRVPRWKRGVSCVPFAVRFLAPIYYLHSRYLLAYRRDFRHSKNSPVEYSGERQGFRAG